MRNSTFDTKATINLWSPGRSESTEVIWLSESHVEMVVSKEYVLNEGEMAAVLLRDFLSLPVRVEMKTGQHVVLQFEQRLHSTVLDAFKQDVIDLALAKAEQAGAQRNLFPAILGDLEVWAEDGEQYEPVEEAA